MAQIFHQWFSHEKSIEDQEKFLLYLKYLIENYSEQSIVGDLIRLFYQKYPKTKDEIVEYLTNSNFDEEIPTNATNRLFLLLDIFPDSTEKTREIYQVLIGKIQINFGHT